MSLTVSADPIPLVTDVDGIIRIAKTRVTLDTVISAFLEGATAEEIIQQYPSLQLADIYLVIGYYLQNQSEVDNYLQVRENFASQIRQENENRFSPIGIRERLLARSLIR